MNSAFRNMKYETGPTEFYLLKTCNKIANINCPLVSMQRYSCLSICFAKSRSFRLVCGTPGTPVFQFLPVRVGIIFFIQPHFYLILFKISPLFVTQYFLFVNSSSRQRVRRICYQQCQLSAICETQTSQNLDNIFCQKVLQTF